jgi:putative DNA modification/repair radical SAM protein
VRVAKDLRLVHKFNGYIHLKAIPGSSAALIAEAGLYADRMSVNIEIPTETNLKLLAPDKNFKDTYTPMFQIRDAITENKEERKAFRSAPKFVPGGQSTQLIIGASPESDHQILSLASGLYQQQQLKRVYYSGFLPVNAYDQRLPALKEPPLVRENRLYQSDWLMRFYFFKADEIVNSQYPNLDLEIDPKLSYALRNLHLYPIDINKADYEMILRVPGIGVQSAKMIVQARRYSRLNFENLKKIGVVMKRAKYFITCSELMPHQPDLQAEALRYRLLTDGTKKGRKAPSNQLDLFSQPLLLPR